MRGPRHRDGYDTLHGEVRALLVERIFRGAYADGARLPTERELAAELTTSRVTVRTALAALEAEGLVLRRQGHGTRLTLRTRGAPSALALVAVLAPVQNPFFAAFLRPFEAAAEAERALVVVKGTANGRPAEAVLFELFARDVRDAVVWPYDARLDPEALRRLRGLGMNLVLFDHAPAPPSADAVAVDNAHAIAALFARLRERGSERPCFLGWDAPALSSNAEREAAFLDGAGGGRTLRLPWRAETGVEADVAAALRRLPPGTDGLLCGNGHVGLAAQRLVRAGRLPLPVVCVDDLPGAAALHLDAYAQPMDALARAVWTRLAAQAREPDDWEPATLRLRGELLRRHGGRPLLQPTAAPKSRPTA